MTRCFWACGGAALGLCLSAVEQSLFSLAYAPHGEPITCEQLQATRYLAWPQSYAAIKDLLGTPEHWSRGRDLYRAPGGYLEVTYLADGMAWGALGGHCEF